MDPRKKLVGVESVAVVWEVRESVYSSSSLLSSVRNLSGISLEEEVSFDVSPETSCLEASLGSVGVAGRGEDPFPVSSWGALWHTRQLTIFFFLFLRVWGIFPPCSSACLSLPCKGSKRLQCSTLVLPPAIHFTLYTGIPGVGCPIT